MLYASGNHAKIFVMLKVSPRFLSSTSAQRLVALPAALALVIAAVVGAALAVTALTSSSSHAATPTLDRVPAAATNGNTNGPNNGNDDAVNRKLKAALLESQTRLGELEPWQKKIFDEEAVPQYQRFIRDYRSSQTHSGSAISNLAVDIDMESLKNYLKFYAPKTLKRTEKDTAVLLYMRSGEGCEKCVASGPGIRKLVQARVLRRGFKPVWLSADDLAAAGGGEPDAELAGKALEKRVAELASTRNAAGYLVLEWAPAPVDEVDSMHADEKRYVIHSSLQARGLGGSSAVAPAPGALAKAPATSGRVEGKMEIMEDDAFEAAAARLLTDAFTDLGAQSVRTEAAQRTSVQTQANNEAGDVSLDVSGISDFSQLTKLKAAIQGKLSADATVEERRIARGKITLAVVGEKSAEAVRPLLAGLEGVKRVTPMDGGFQLQMRSGPAAGNGGDE
jgi:hypothetical protein